MDEPNFDEYQDLFIQCVNNMQNQELMQNFLQLKSSLLMDNPEKYFGHFIEFNINIFCNSEIPEKSRVQAAIFIKDGLLAFEFKVVRIFWLNLPDRIHDYTLNTLFQALSSEIPATRNICSECIACISLLELDNKKPNKERKWYQFCEKLYQFIIEKDKTENLFIGAISCLAALFNYQLIQQTDIPEGLIEIMRILQQILIQKVDHIYAIQNAAVALYRIIRQTPGLYPPEQIHGFIEMAREAFQPPMPPTQTANFYSAILDILLELIKQNYQCFLENPPLIQNICGLLSEQIRSQKAILKCYDIYFLTGIVDFETQNGRTSTFSTILGAQFVNDLLQCLIDIEDPENENPEDPTDNPPHMAAASALYALFNHNQQEIFNAVKFFYEMHINSENWIEIHGSIYSIIAICTNPNNDPPEPILEFLSFAFPFIISQAGEPCFNLRTKETSLWIISKIITSYPQLILLPGLSSNLYDLFIQSFNPQYPPLIIKRASTIFSILARNCDENFLNERFDKTADLILDLVHSFEPNPSINPPDIITPLFSALNSLIMYSSPMVNEQIKSLLDKLFEDISNPYLTSSICLTASSAFTKIPEFIIPELNDYATKLLYVIKPTLGASHQLKSCSYVYREPLNESQLFIEIYKATLDTEFVPNSFDTDIWECTLIALCHLLTFHSPNIQLLAFSLFSTMYNALSVSSENLCCLAIRGLGKLFDTLSSDITHNYLHLVLSRIDDIYDMACGFVSFRLALIYMYANIIKRLGSVYIDLNNEREQRMFERINQSAATVFTLSSAKEINDVNEMILYAYFCIFGGFDRNRTFLLDISKQNIFPLIESIWKNKVFNEKSLNALYQLIYSIGNTLTNQVNIDLNRRYVKNLVRQGCEIESIRKTAEDLLDFLENAI